MFEFEQIKNIQIDILKNEISKKISEFIFPDEISKNANFNEYLNFLKLKIIAIAIFNDQEIPPSKIILQIWDDHINENKNNYLKFIKSLSNIINLKNLERFVEENKLYKTIYFYKNIFKKDPKLEIWLNSANFENYNFTDQTVYY